jgi:hypothetical protein
MRCLLLLSLLIINVSTTLKAQYTTFVKTNVLNLPFVPSIHVEQQVKKNASLQLDVHYAKFVAIGNNEFLNMAITYRKYFSKQPILNGLYTGPSLTLHHNVLATEFIDSVTTLRGNTYLGAGGKLGYQKLFAKQRWCFDVNLGALMHLIQTKEFTYFNRKIEVRAMLGIGYRIHK